LNLRNAHIGNLTDTKDAWPSKGQLVLNGTTFEHLGGHQGPTEQEMLKRGAEWWDENWAALNPKYSPSLARQSGWEGDDQERILTVAAD
jgi:hypothetical protein